MSEFTPIDFNGSEAHLRDCLLERNLYIPYGDNNKLIRKQAVKLLQEWETTHTKHNGEKVKVIFHRSMNPSAGSSVYASINGENFQAPFEKEVIIKRFFLTECIDRAKTTTTKKVPQANDPTKYTYTEEYVQLYPYTFLGVVEDKEENNN